MSFSVNQEKRVGKKNIYSDDIFVLFTWLEQFEAFRNFSNGRRANMSFTIKNEKQNSMFSLYV